MICFITIFAILTPSTQAFFDTGGFQRFNDEEKFRMTFFVFGRIKNLEVSEELGFTFITFDPINVRLTMRFKDGQYRTMMSERYNNSDNSIELVASSNKVYGMLRENFVCAFLIFEEEF
jgi:hypothetical protein